jgi:hypothetical protein
MKNSKKDFVKNAGFKSEPLYWFFELRRWAVVVAIFHEVKVKTYGRNNIYWRDIYKISLRPLLFPVGSLDELLIPVGLLF